MFHVLLQSVEGGGRRRMTLTNAGMRIGLCLSPSLSLSQSGLFSIQKNFATALLACETRITDGSCHAG